MKELPLSVLPSTGYQDLVRLLRTRAGSSKAVIEVVDAAGRLVGVVSDTDLSSARERLPRLARRLGPPLDSINAEALVAGDLMRPPTRTTGSSA